MAIAEELTTAPAMRLIKTLDLFVCGMMMSKNSCVSLLIPETGFKSVSPRALTPMMLSISAINTAAIVADKGTRCPKTTWMAKTQNAMDKARPMDTTLELNSWSNGASMSRDKDAVPALHPV